MIKISIYFVTILVTTTAKALDIELSPTNVTILEGTSHGGFECTIENSKEFKVEWLKNNKVVSTQLGRIDFKYPITKGNRSDTGEYKCRVFRNDALLTESDPAYLKVLPKQNCYPDKKIYNVGETMNVICEVENLNLDPELEWIDFGKGQDLRNETHIIKKNSIRIIEEYATKVFTCQMKLFTADKTRAIILVNHLCRLDSIEINVNVTIIPPDNLMVGQSAFFQCKTGHKCPQCEYQWSINNTDLLVNVSHLNLNISIEMIGSELTCYVSSYNVHGSAVYRIHETQEKEKSKSSEKDRDNTKINTVVIVAAVVFPLLTLVAIIRLCCRYKHEVFNCVQVNDKKCKGTQQPDITEVQKHQQCSLTKEGIISECLTDNVKPDPDLITSGSHQEHIYNDIKGTVIGNQEKPDYNTRQKKEEVGLDTKYKTLPYKPPKAPKPLLQGSKTIDTRSSGCPIDVANPAPDKITSEVSHQEQIYNEINETNIDNQKKLDCNTNKKKGTEMDTKCNTTPYKPLKAPKPIFKGSKTIDTRSSGCPTDVANQAPGKITSEVSHQEQIYNEINETNIDNQKKPDYKSNKRAEMDTKCNTLPYKPLKAPKLKFEDSKTTIVERNSSENTTPERSTKTLDCRVSTKTEILPEKNLSSKTLETGMSAKVLESMGSSKTPTTSNIVQQSELMKELQQSLKMPNANKLNFSNLMQEAANHVYSDPDDELQERNHNNESIQKRSLPEVPAISELSSECLNAGFDATPESGINDTQTYCEISDNKLEQNNNLLCYATTPFTSKENLDEL